MSPLSTNFAEKVLSKIGKLDRRRVERFVRGVVSERNFFEVIFEAMGEGVVVTGPDGSVLMINPTARALLGLRRRARARGRPLLDLIRDATLREVLSRWSGERVDQAEVLLEQPQARDLLMTLRSVRDDTGEASANVLILADVTEHHQREREQTRAEHLSSLAVLTAGVAHEIKNPLNSLRIHGQLLSQALADASWECETRAERAGRSADIILAALRRGVYHEIENAGHLIGEDQPAAYAAAIQTALHQGAT